MNVRQLMEFSRMGIEVKQVDPNLQLLDIYTWIEVVVACFLALLWFMFRK